jgi:hypothetical protein
MELATRARSHHPPSVVNFLSDLAREYGT